MCTILDPIWDDIGVPREGKALNLRHQCERKVGVPFWTSNQKSGGSTYVKAKPLGLFVFKSCFFFLGGLRYFEVFSHPCHTSHGRLVCLTESRWVGWLTGCNIRRFETFILPLLFAVWSRFTTCRAACRARNLPLNARTGMCPSDGNKGCSQKHIVHLAVLKPPLFI